MMRLWEEDTEVSGWFSDCLNGGLMAPLQDVN